SLQGFASTIRATGQYEKDIQTARLLREQSRQARLDTERRAFELASWYNSVRPTTPRMLEAQRAADLDRVRNTPSGSDIQSSHALNVLLESIQKAGRLSRGPNVPLTEDTLKHVNLTGGTSSGNVGMLKEGTKLAWPETLQAEAYDVPRKRLTRNLR